MELVEHTPDLTGASTPKVEARNKSSFYDPQKTEELLSARPALGVEIREELRTRFDEALIRGYVVSCYSVEVDPNALERTAQLNKELQAQLREARNQIQALFIQIQGYLLELDDEWRRMPDERRLHIANLQVHNHIRAELQDLEELAERYGVLDLEIPGWPKRNPFIETEEETPWNPEN